MSNSFSSKTEDHKPAINIVQREGISAIWLVPIIAVCFASWLFFKGLSERGVFIQIQFDSVQLFPLPLASPARACCLYRPPGAQ